MNRINHTNYDAPCELNFRLMYFIFCKFYVAAREFNNSTIVSITPRSGPSIANVFASVMLERQTLPKTLIWYNHMSSEEPVSCKRVRLVRAASSGHWRNAKRVHVGG